MKYIIIPIFRVVSCVVILTIGVPICFYFALLSCLWNWSYKPIRELAHGVFEEFWLVNKFDYLKNTYWVYKNPWDFIKGKKTLITKYE